MEDNNEGAASFLGEMLKDAMDKDPRMAMQMMMAAFKMPVLTQYVEEHKDELNAVMTVHMSAGEALFLYAACLQSIASMANNNAMRSDGAMHVHLLRDYADIGMKFAKMVETIGYPEQTPIADMAGAIASVDGAFEKVKELHEKLSSGDISLADAHREFQ